MDALIFRAAGCEVFVGDEAKAFPLYISKIDVDEFDLIESRPSWEGIDG